MGGRGWRSEISSQGCRIATAEEMAGLLSSASSVSDLKSQEVQLKELVRRVEALNRETRRVGKVPPEVLAEISGQLDDLRPGMGRRRDVTVMFCGLFVTPLAEEVTGTVAVQPAGTSFAQT